MNAKTQGVGYHISPQDQIARECGGNIQGCRFGISEEGHMNAEEAAAHNAKVAQGTNPTVQTLKKPQPKKSVKPTKLPKEQYKIEVVNGMTTITFDKEQKLTPEFAEEYAKSFIFDKYDEIHQVFIVENLPTDENSFILNNDLEMLKKTYPEAFATIEKKVAESGKKAENFHPAHYLTELEDLIREEEKKQIWEFWRSQGKTQTSEREIQNMMNDGVYDDNPSKKYSFE